MKAGRTPTVDAANQSPDSLWADDTHSRRPSRRRPERTANQSGSLLGAATRSRSAQALRRAPRPHGRRGYGDRDKTTSSRVSQSTQRLAVFLPGVDKQRFPSLLANEIDTTAAGSGACAARPSLRRRRPPTDSPVSRGRERSAAQQDRARPISFRATTGQGPTWQKPIRRYERVSDLRRGTHECRAHRACGGVPSDGRQTGPDPGGLLTAIGRDHAAASR